MFIVEEPLPGAGEDHTPRFQDIGTMGYPQ